MKTREKLTTEEKSKLHEFFAKCVSENVVFPSSIPGTNGSTIQELVHQRNTSSLDRFADFLEKQINNVTRTERRNGVSEKVISGSKITFREAVEMIDLIIKDNEYKIFVESQREKIAEIKNQLKDLQTPEEKRKELEEALKIFEGVSQSNEN